MAHNPEGHGLYDGSLDGNERAVLSMATTVEGIDQEIALLRERLAWLVKAQPEEIGLQIKIVREITRCVAVKARLTSSSEDELFANLLGVIKGVGGTIWPERFEEV